jgi:branched-chain amino acid transport system substrate-binding protein
MMKILLFGLSSLCLFILLIFPGQIQAADSVKISLSLGLSGKYAKMAEMQKKGFELWAAQVNQKGGFLGRIIDLNIADDYSDKERAAKLYGKFILKDKVDFVFGPYSSGITGKVMPIVNENGYPFLISGGASDKLWQKGYSNIFGVFIPASRYAVGFLEMAAMHNLESFSIVYADDPFSETIALGAKQWAEKFGLKIKLFEKFAKGNRNLSFLALKAKESGGSAVVVCGHLNESVDFRRGLKKIDWYPKAYFATVGPAMDVFSEKLGGDSDFAFSSSQWEPSIIFKPGDHEQFLKPFIAKYGHSPSYHAALAYASGQILEMAVKKVKSLEHSRINDILRKMDVTTVIGRYGVDKNGMQIKHFPITIQRQNGKKVVVWPDELAKAKPVFLLDNK